MSRQTHKLLKTTAIKIVEKTINGDLAWEADYKWEEVDTNFPKAILKIITFLAVATAAGYVLYQLIKDHI